MGCGGMTEMQIAHEAQAQALFTAYTLEAGLHTYISTRNMTSADFASGKAILDAAPEVQVAVVRAALRYSTKSRMTVPVSGADENGLDCGSRLAGRGRSPGWRC